MATDKKSIIVYSDWEEYFSELTMEERGILITHFFDYVNDRNPELSDRVLKAAFKPMELQLKRDLEKWKGIKLKRSEAGKAGGLKSGQVRQQNEANEANASTLNQNEANEAVNVIMCNSVLDGTDILLEKETKDVRFNFKHELFKLSGNQDLVNDWMAVRKTKRATNTKTAFDGFLSEVVKSGLDINDVLRKCVMQSWSGFKAEWTTKNNNLNIIHHEQFAELTAAIRNSNGNL